MNAAVGPLPKPVWQTYRDYADELHLHGESDYTLTLSRIEKLRQTLAKFIGAENSQSIGFVPNTSYAMNVIAHHFKKNRERPGEVVLPEEEFPSSVIPWFHHGYNVKRVPVDKILENVGPNTAAVVHSVVQFFSGYRADLESIAQELRQRKIPLVLNATQALGAYRFSIEKLRPSAVCASFHKWMCAGFGTGFVYFDPSETPLHLLAAGWAGVEDPMALSTGDPKLKVDVTSVETGVGPYASWFALGSALELVNQIGIGDIENRLLEFSKVLVSGLSEIVGRERILTTPRHESAIVTIQCQDPGVWERALAAQNIFVNARRNGLRISPHYYNTLEELERVIAAVKTLAKQSANA